MNAQELWQKYCSQNNIDSSTPYEAWSFGNGDKQADDLALLVMRGIKFGTASAYEEYISEGEEIPHKGDYSVILSSTEEPLCIIKNYDVQIESFGNISCFHAYSEGEEDRNINSWRDIHSAFFTESLSEINIKLNEDTPIVIEKFSVEQISEAGLTLLKENGFDSIKSNSDDVVFLEPCEEYINKLQSYRQEIESADGSYDGLCGLQKYEDIGEWIKKTQEKSRPLRKLEDQDIVSTILLCVRKADDKIVGTINIRHTLNDYLREYAGHIGYNVRPSEQRKGYAKKMLRFALNYCDALGINPVELSAEPENTASRKTILSCGGKFRDTVSDEGREIYLDRYLIQH